MYHNEVPTQARNQLLPMGGSGNKNKLKYPERRRRELLGGSGGMLPRENLKSRYPEKRFPAFLWIDFHVSLAYK